MALATTPYCLAMSKEGTRVTTHARTAGAPNVRSRQSKKRPASQQAAWKGEAYASWDLPTAARRVSEGLSPDALNVVQDRLDLSNAELAHVVHISPRTLTRRKKEERLSPDESERVYRVARLIEIAARVLGSEDEAREWMKEPNYALGEQVPLEVARTEPGAELVERLLGQIEHGITV